VTSEPRTWFITGASRGFGRLLAERALAAGDRVVATARNPEDVRDLVDHHSDAIMAVRLDVTDSAQIAAAVEAALAGFGRIDILFNNAGYGLQGAAEDATDAQIREIFATNVFGVIGVARAVLPSMRANRGGHILNVASHSGRESGPTLAYYSATKFAIEGFSDGLRQEVAQFGINVTVVEPGPFKTDFATRSLQLVPPSPAYEEMVNRMNAYLAGLEFADPREVVDVVMRIVEMPEPPLHAPIGDICQNAVEKLLERETNAQRAWRAMTVR